MSHRLKTYDYTPKGRLSRRTWARGATYAYDHRGRMVRKNISHRDTEPQRIEYLWDGWNIIRETNTNLSTFQPFNFSTDYFWGLDLDGTLQGSGGVGGLLAVIRDDGVFLPAYDANGNITEYVATNGNVAAHYEYSAFGESVVTSGELAATFTHQFSTKPYCAVTGLSEYQMRKYRVEIGRWMSRDPIGHLGGYNLLAFVNNSPCCCGDFLGLIDPVYYDVEGPYYQLVIKLGEDEWGHASALLSYKIRKGTISNKKERDPSCSDCYRKTVTYSRNVEFYVSDLTIKLPRWTDYANASSDEKKRGMP